jgi:hypothetical protein
MSAQKEIEGLAVVLVGSFNPTIYQPEWFARMGLIRDEEVMKDSKIEVIHSEIVSHTIGSIKIQAQSERFSASTVNASDYEVLRDLVAGTFKILTHTPIRMFGINFDAHFRMASEDAWHKLGDRLAPKEPWTKILKNPGMVTVTLEGKRQDDFAGYVRVKVEPSARIKPGVYIVVNNHYQDNNFKPEKGCDEILDVLTSTWDASIKQSSLICDSIVEN